MKSGSFEAGFKFAEQLKDPSFRAYLSTMGARGCPVICVSPQEGGAEITVRVAEAFHQFVDNVVLVINLDDTEPWGLRIIAHKRYSLN